MEKVIENGIVYKREYWDPQRKIGIMYEFPYVDGFPNGMFRQWYHDGGRHLEVFLKRGFDHGIAKKWYPSGDRSFLRSYKNGRSDGVYVNFGWDED